MNLMFGRPLQLLYIWQI